MYQEYTVDWKSCKNITSQLCLYKVKIHIKRININVVKYFKKGNDKHKTQYSGYLCRMGGDR